MTEEKFKVFLVILDTILNSLGIEKDYDFYKEALEWAKKYFPELTMEDFLSMAREYDEWNEFEEVCRELEMGL